MSPVLVRPQSAGRRKDRFDIKGNNFRLVTYIDFERGFVAMKWFGTHAEYDKEGWK